MMVYDVYCVGPAATLYLYINFHRVKIFSVSVLSVEMSPSPNTNKYTYSVCIHTPWVVIQYNIVYAPLFTILYISSARLNMLNIAWLWLCVCTVQWMNECVEQRQQHHQWQWWWCEILSALPKDTLTHASKLKRITTEERQKKIVIFFSIKMKTILFIFFNIFCFFFLLYLLSCCVFMVFSVKCACKFCVARERKYVLMLFYRLRILFSRIHITESVSITIVILLGIRFECLENCIYLCDSVSFHFASIFIFCYVLSFSFLLICFQKLTLIYTVWQWFVFGLDIASGQWNEIDKTDISIVHKIHTHTHTYVEGVCDWVKIHLKAS